jgi:AcrR family transcriptional regulator
MGRASDATAAPRLLEAAEAIFVEHGLDRARVEDITALARVSKGSFYLHFESKEAAFRHVVEAIVSTMGVYMESSLSSDGDGEVGNLGEYFERRVVKEAALYEYLWSSRRRIRLLLDGGKSSAFLHLMDEFADRARRNAVKVFEAGIAKGLYRSDFDVELASIYVAGAYDRLARHVVRLEEKPDFVAMLRLMQRLVLRGLATDDVLCVFDAPASTRQLRASLL